MLAALGSLTMQKRFLENVLPKDQGFQSDYAGIFHFRVCILCCIGTAGIWLVGLHRGQNCSPRSRHLCMLWFFSAESQFRIFQKTPSFLMGPHAPGGTIKLQGIWSPFLKVMTYAQLQSYSYQLFEQICVHILKDILKSALISTFYCDCQCTCGFYLFWHFLFSNILQFALLTGGIYLKLQILGNRWDEWRFNSERGASSLVNFTVYQLLKFSESPVWVSGILSVRPWFLVSESAKYLTGLKALASRS